MIYFYFTQINFIFSVHPHLLVPIADIKGLLTGKDCPHMKENKGKQNKVSSAPHLLRLWSSSTSCHRWEVSLCLHVCVSLCYRKCWIWHLASRTM